MAENNENLTELYKRVKHEIEEKNTWKAFLNSTEGVAAAVNGFNKLHQTYENYAKSFDRSSMRWEGNRNFIFETYDVFVDVKLTQRFNNSLDNAKLYFTVGKLINNGYGLETISKLEFTPVTKGNQEILWNDQSGKGHTLEEVISKANSTIGPVIEAEMKKAHGF